MVPFSCLLVAFLLYSSVIDGRSIIEDTTDNEINTVIGDYYGIKIRIQEVGMPMFLTPVIFLPLINLKRSNNNNKEEGLNEIEILTLKILTDDIKSAHSEKVMELNFRQSLDRGSKEIKKRSDPITNNNVTLNTSNLNHNMLANLYLNKSETQVDVSYNINNITQSAKENTQQFSNTIVGNSMYTTLPYVTKNIESLALADTAAEWKLPPAKDERWKKFVANNTLEHKPHKPTDLPLMGVTGTGSYPSALYNGMIDHISITTNSYTNMQSSYLPKVDGWHTISSVPSPKHNGFKPLAGLYYDGFLGKPPVKFPH